MTRSRNPKGTFTTALTILVACGLTCTASAQAAPVAKYQSLRSVRIGPFEMSAIATDIIGVRYSKPSGTDLVEGIEWKLKAGTTVRLCKETPCEATPILKGTVGVGTPLDPAASLEGDVLWRDGKMTQFRGVNLSVRLVGVTFAADVIAGHLTVSSSETVFLSASKSRIGNGIDVAMEGSGSFDVSLPKARLQSAQTRWGDWTFSAPLVLADATVRVPVDGTAPSLRTAAMTFDKQPVLTIATPVSALIPHHVLSKGRVSLEQFKLTVLDGVATASASRLSAEDVAVTFSRLPSVAVVGVDAIRVSDLKSTGGIVSSAGFVFSAPAARETVVVPEAMKVINRLNTYGRFAPEDALIPLGDPFLQYSRLSALSKLYGGLGASAQGPNSQPKSELPAASPGPVPAPSAPPAAAAPIVVLRASDGVVVEAVFPNGPADTPQARQQFERQLNVVYTFQGPPVLGAAGAGQATVRLLSAAMARPAARTAVGWLRQQSALHPQLAKVMLSVRRSWKETAKNLGGQAYDQLVSKIPDMANATVLWLVPDAKPIPPLGPLTGPGALKEHARIRALLDGGGTGLYSSHRAELQREVADGTAKVQAAADARAQRERAVDDANNAKNSAFAKKMEADKKEYDRIQKADIEKMQEKVGGESTGGATGGGTGGQGGRTGGQGGAAGNKGPEMKIEHKMDPPKPSPSPSPAPRQEER